MPKVYEVRPRVLVWRFLSKLKHIPEDSFKSWISWVQLGSQGRARLRLEQSGVKWFRV